MGRIAGELADSAGDLTGRYEGTLYRHPGRPAINVARARRSTSRAQRPIPFTRGRPHDEQATVRRRLSGR